MGAIQEPTPAMGPYWVEIRGESFYLTRGNAPAGVVTQPGRHEVVVPAGDAPHILAALDQVAAHPQWQRWPRPAEGEQPDTSWTRAPGGQGPAADPHWTVTLDGDRLHLRGPWVVYHETHRHLLGTELCYRDVPQLRDALAAVTKEA
ncbi:hypothetical protein ACFOOM_00960 [Streptomyces echinoruber]|uniref:Uncharacterized protein n=1 Tax=Streptomyces echinoruber TaxID=68898 RepID=A0A918QYM7_9ACTN|nr:hypothetical protein [Streptomyces echinoruber]GGZ73209.1 hypothetical protein GCM10010389_08420 [Streptomyces echinoruber]